MALKIKWTPEASESFENVISYLRSEWSEKSAMEFGIRVSKALNLLLAFPRAGKRDERGTEIRALLITKQTKLFYRLKGEYLVLLRFWDTRRDKQNYE
ncbi:MAG: type II toxin-antitoxin system RelE/ParE family toxin [bacterium]